jgi:hypothetical protein
MFAFLNPLSFIITSIAGWLNQYQQHFIDYLIEESGPAATESDRGTRTGAGWQLNFLNSNTLHIEAQGSGHEIHLFQPERVVEGIARAVSTVRTGLPLSRMFLGLTHRHSSTVHLSYDVITEYGIRVF